MAEKTNVPEIRFAGFTDPWEQRKLGELLLERNEQAPQSDQYPLMAFIANQGIAPKGDRYDRSALVNDIESKLYKRTEKGDFIYSSNNLETGSIGLNKYGNACISPVYCIFQPSGIADSDFLGRRLVRKDFIQEMVKWRQGVIYGQWRIHEADFLRLNIAVPSVDEQRLIGKLLDNLDALITLHQRKYDKLAQLKKSMLDKMFPKPGERFPEIRFAGFTDPWEQRKLGNCGTTYSGLSGKTKEDFGHGNARFVPYTNVYDSPLTDTKRLEAVEIDPSQNKVAYGDVFFTVSSETPDEVGMSSVWLSDQEDVYLNSFCFGYRQDSTFDPHYLAYMLRSSSMRSNLTLLAQGISRFNISKSKVMELSVPVPSAVEQKQIGRYFAELDNLITLHQRKLELLRNTKKSLLDRMFV